MLLVKVFRVFNRCQVHYLVVGGVASVLYGNPRFTKELDLWVDPSESNLRKVIKAFHSLRFIPRNPVKAEEFISEENRKRWKKEKGMLAFTFINPKVPFENVDLLFGGPISFRIAYLRTRFFRSGRVHVPTISRRDLIQMKQKAGRTQDLYDIEILKAARKVQK